MGNAWPFLCNSQFVVKGFPSLKINKIKTVANIESRPQKSIKTEDPKTLSSDQRRGTRKVKQNDYVLKLKWNQGKKNLTHTCKRC